MFSGDHTFSLSFRKIFRIVENVPYNKFGMLHPTAQKLVDTVIVMLETIPYTSIKSETVLSRSGISRGPLYHHFQDFDDLISEAHTQIYKNSANHLAMGLIDGIALANTPSEALRMFLSSLNRLVAQDSSGRRRILLGVLHDALSTIKVRKEISAIQESITERWIEIHQLCIERGWASNATDSRVVAIIMQSALLGSTFDDLSPKQINQDIWIQTLSDLFQHFFLGNEEASEVDSVA